MSGDRPVTKANGVSVVPAVTVAGVVVDDDLPLEDQLITVREYLRQQQMTRYELKLKLYVVTVATPNRTKEIQAYVDNIEVATKAINALKKLIDEIEMQCQMTKKDGLVS
jgi:hypothetical protein